MGRRRRQWREPGFVWWIAIGVLLVAALLFSAWRLALLAVLVWCLYEFALIPTACRVMTRQGFACHEPVRGRLYACTGAHQRIKTDAIWRAAGLPNPFRHSAPPHDPDRDTGVVVYSPAVRARLAQNDRLILTLAGAGTLVTIVAAVISILQ